MIEDLKKRVYLYLLFSFVLAWGVWIGCYVFGASPVVTQVASAAVMWAPAGAIWITRNMTGKGQILAYSLKPKLKSNIKNYLCAWWLPAFAVALGAVLYFCAFQNDFDRSFSALNQLVTQTLGPSADLPVSPLFIAAAQIIGSLIFAPFINMFFALGEEIGWRGFLFPALSQRFSYVKAHLLVGLIWGIWHTPINMMGHNYGLNYPGYPWAGIIAMCIFTFSTGVFLSWLTEKSQSIWPAALAHGSINAAAGIPFLFNAAGAGSSNQIFGPGISALIAGVPMLIFAIALMYREATSDERSKQI